MAPGGHGHAILSVPGGPRGDPFVPQVGDVYLVNTILYSASDPASARPAVVLEADPNPHRLIRVVTRTSDTSVRGVAHRADRALGLERDGVWSDLTSVQQDRWREPDVRRLGTLREDVLKGVRARFS